MPNQPEARFCSSCGAPLEAADEETTLTLQAVEAADAEDELARYLDGLPPGVGLLVVRHGPNAGSSFRLEAEHTNVGRHPDSEIFLDDITVSRRHVVLDRDGERLRAARRRLAQRHLREPRARRRGAAAPRRRGADRPLPARASCSAASRDALTMAKRAHVVDRRRARTSSATSSPTSRSRRSASSRARVSSIPSARRRATASSRRPTSSGCASSCASSASTSCR